MPQYLYPGVYVEETDTGNKPIEGVSTSTAGFIGIAERGPIKPTLCTGYGDFVRSFGSYYKEGGVDRYLAYAVEGFFQNGGQLCFVQRVVHNDTQNRANSAVAASVVVDSKFTITAIGPGIWGNRISYRIDPAGLNNSNLFKLIVMYWADPTAVPKDFYTNPTMTEVFDNLSFTPTSSTFYESEINDVSNLITIKQNTTGLPALTPQYTGKPLANGKDGAAIMPGDFEGDDSDPVNKTGLMALADINEISIICCPDQFYFGANDQTIAGYLVDQCELLKYRFAILQAPVNAGQPENNDPPTSSKYAAYYYPWLNIINASTGIKMLIPPGGHIAGIYARSDSNYNVAKDPANEPILAIDSLQLQINNGQQSILNPKGVNVLRYFKGRGNLVWGGRTTSSDPDWKYINVRRLFIFVEESIDQGTQWAVFEPNDDPLWARVRRSVSDFLTRIWMDGMLQGQTKEQAFFVRCDRTTMTQADIDNGRMIMVIGIAPVKPAEFVIFRIGQWTGGSDVTEG